MRFLLPFMRYIERMANKHLEENIHYYIEKSKYSGTSKDDRLVVSLTSFPARIDNVWKTILSLKTQTYLPGKIILWLSEEEFKNVRVPDSLKEMEDDLFEIRFIDDNLKSHNKYYYALLSYPDDFILTVDDDLFYHPDTIKFLVEKTSDYPDFIISNRVRKIKKNDGEVSPYLSWKVNPAVVSHKDFFFLGVDGVLYPPGSLHKLVFNSELAMRISPSADDVWLNAVARLQGSRVAYSGFKWRHIPICSNTPSLESINCVQGKNDVQIRDVNKYVLDNFNKKVF